MKSNRNLLAGSIAGLLLLNTCPSVLAESSEPTESSVIYVSGNGTEDADGLSADTPVNSIKKAYENVSDGGTIVVCGNVDFPDSSEQMDAKSVTITSVFGDEDFRDIAVWKDRGQMMHLSGNTILKGINLASSSSGYGFLSNGYDFVVGEDVDLQLGSEYDDLYICGASADEDDPDGANISVLSGSGWVVYGAGYQIDGKHVEEDVNIYIGGNASPRTVVAGAKQSEYGDEGFAPTEFKNVNITIDRGASVQEIYLGSELYFGGRSKQAVDGTVTLNLNEGATVGSVYAGGQYAYHAKEGQIQELSNVVINYNGANIEDTIYLGGADAVYHPDYDDAAPSEAIGCVTINLNKSLPKNITIMPGIRADIGAGLDDNGDLETSYARISYIGDTTGHYIGEDKEGTDIYDGAVNLQYVNKRIARFQNTKDERRMEYDFLPHIIEFVDNGKLTLDYMYELEKVLVDETDAHVVLNASDGEECEDNNGIPYFTATDAVESDNGRIVLQPVLTNDEFDYTGTILFAVPAASDDGGQTSMTVDSYMTMFALDPSIEDYHLEYMSVQDIGLYPALDPSASENKFGYIVMTKDEEPEPEPTATPEPEPTVTPEPTPSATPEPSATPTATPDSGTSAVKPSTSGSSSSAQKGYAVQSYDDGGPFTRNTYGDVLDRWGNVIWRNPNAKRTTSDGTYRLVKTGDTSE